MRRRWLCGLAFLCSISGPLPGNAQDAAEAQAPKGTAEAQAKDKDKDKDKKADAGAASEPASGGIEAELRRSVLDNIKFTEAEDVVGTMRTIHSRSPQFQGTRKQLSQVFGKKLNLKYELVSVKYLATEGDYAFARVVQRTMQDPPVQIKNSEADMVIAFKKEGGAWKFWNQMVLEHRFLKPEANKLP